MSSNAAARRSWLSRAPRPVIVPLFVGAALAIAAACSRFEQGDRADAGTADSSPPGAATDGPIGDGGQIADPVVQVSAGHGSACAVRASGQLWCWGRVTAGAIATAPTVGIPCFGPNATSELCLPTPTRVLGLLAAEMVVEAHTGRYFGCARTKGGDVYCWGDNTNLQLGVTAQTVASASSVPVKVPIPAARSLSVGGEQACAVVDADGGRQVWCWGRDDTGQLGRGPEVDAGVDAGSVRAKAPGPIAWSAAHDQVTLGLGISLSCARAADEVRCWGINAKGSLGHAPDAGGDRPCEFVAGDYCNATPSVVAGGFTSLEVAGQYFGCGWTTSAPGSPSCWGADLYAASGRGLHDSNEHPAPVPASALPPDVTHLSARFTHTCVVTTSSELYCVGSNSWSELAGPGGSQSCLGVPCDPTPRRVEGLRVRDVSAGYGFTVAIADDGSLWAWGANGLGTLGHGPATNGDINCPTSRPGGGAPTCNPVPTRIPLP